MRVFHTVSGLREALKADRLKGLRIGFVPTMGNLHDGHLALVKQARSSCDIVVCSIFVNALQFGLNEDWDKYPRTYQQDCDKLRETGCDYLFHPDDTEMYPNGLGLGPINHLSIYSGSYINGGVVNTLGVGGKSAKLVVGDFPAIHMEFESDGGAV